MNAIKRDFKRRLACIEAKTSEIEDAELTAARHRRLLRWYVHACNLIGKRFLRLGLDPTSVAGLKLGEEAAAELGAIPDTEALRMADEAIVHRYSIACGTASSEFIANIERSASNMCKNFKADLANASLEDFINSTSINFANASFVELLTFNTAIDYLIEAVNTLHD